MHQCSGVHVTLMSKNVVLLNLTVARGITEPNDVQSLIVSFWHL